MTRVIIAKSNLDIIQKNVIDWTIDSNKNLLLAIDNETSDPKVGAGFCKYCDKFIENFLYNHQNIYCINNLNKNEEEVTRFKEKEKERLSRKVKCCCEKIITYSSLTKHRLGNFHINNAGHDSKYTEL